MSLIRRTILAASLIVGSILPVAAQTVSAAGPFLMVPLGYCQLAAISAATALSSCSGGIPSGAQAASIAIETTSVRYRDDGVNPTASVGMLLAIGGPSFYTGTLSKLVVIPTAATSTVDVLFYKLVTP